jgi:hypothetical protein
MGKFLRSRRRVVALVGVLGAASAVAVGLAVSLGGAADQPSTEVAVNAKTATARVVSQANVDVASLPQLAAGESTGTPQTMKDLSPIGESALETAKQNAPTLAPTASQVMSASPQTPGGAVLGWEGLKDSATVCSYFGSGCQPPDMAIASDGTNVVQVVNTTLGVYDAKTGTAKGAFSLQTFFGVPAPTPSGCDSAHANQPFLSDPRAYYEQVKKRFVVAALQVENAFGLSPSCTFASRYWVAVSATENPLGSWHVYAINTANLVGPGNSAADYTQLGTSEEAIFIGGNQFNQAGTAYNGAWTLAIPKSKAESGSSIGSVSGFAGYTANDGTANQLLDTVQPVVQTASASGAPGELLVSSFNTGTTESKVVVFDFSNPLKKQSSGQTLSGVVVNTLAYAEPPQADNYPSCTGCLETIDNRISGIPVYMNGNIYFSHDSAVNNGSFTNANVLYGVIHPVLSQPSSGCTLCSTITGGTSVVDQNYIVYAGQTDDWFGIVQPDREGNLFIGYDYGSVTNKTSPSIAYIAKRATAPGFPDSGFFLRVAANATTNSRWGDYEAAGFEGWGSNKILIAAQYAGSNGDWATHIDRVYYATPDQR